MHSPISHLPDSLIQRAVGSRLRSLREMQGLALGTAAEHCGMTAEKLAEIEAGGSTLAAGQIVRLAQTYGTTPNDIFADLASVMQRGATQADIDHLLKHFLGVDEPGRGRMFRQFIASLHPQGD